MYDAHSLPSTPPQRTITPTKMTTLNKSMEFDAGGGEASGSEDSDEDLLEQFTSSEFYTAGECTVLCVELLHQ